MSHPQITAEDREAQKGWTIIQVTELASDRAKTQIHIFPPPKSTLLTTNNNSKDD